MSAVFPDWVPNIHPLVLHLPIAWLVLAVTVDVVAVFARRWTWGGPAATALYVLGALSAVAAYYTGTWAAESVFVPPEAAEVLATHLQYSWYTLLYAGTYGLLRLGLAFVPTVQDSLPARLVLLLLGAGALVPLWMAEEDGRELVYRHGVGVQAAQQAAAPDTTEAAVPDSLLGLVVRGDGWSWIPQSAGGWKDRVEWVRGAPTDVRSYLFEPEGSGQKGLALRVDDGPVLFTVPTTMGSVEVSAELNLDDFDGTVRLVHHVRGARYYDFFGIGGDRLLLARLEGQQLQTYDTGERTIPGWNVLRVVADGSNFRAYVEDTLVLDGNGPPAGPGTTGLYLDGEGTIRIRQMQASEVSGEE